MRSVTDALRARVAGMWFTGTIYGLAIGVALLVPDVAQAYVGPGLGLTAIGTILTFLSAIFLALVGFVWYPIKKLLRALTRKSAPPK